MTTAFRANVVAGLVAMVDAYGAANSGTLGACQTERPTHFASPIAQPYISDRPERISHDSGTRERVMSPSVTIVKAGTQTMTSFDSLVDALIDHFTGYPHIVTGTIWDRMTVADGREDVGDGSSLPNVTFTFENLAIREGRT